MKFRKFLSAAAIGLLCAGSAPAATIDLAFIIDESSSVGSSNYDNARAALSAALAVVPPPDPTGDTYRITIIEFSSSAYLKYSGTDVSAAQAALSNDTYSGGSTCYSCAFSLLNSTIGTIGSDVGIVNMLTDGSTNVSLPGSGLSAEDDAIKQRDALIASGWDSLSFEAAVNSSGTFALDTDFLVKLGFDANGVGSVPIIGSAGDISDPLNQSFILKISDYNAEYKAAVEAKIQRTANPNPVPLPGGLPLMAGGLLLLGWTRTRRKAV